MSCFVYFLVSTSLWIFHGPFPSVRNYVIDTVDETRHGYLLRPLSLFTLPESVIKAHALANGGMVSQTIPISQIQTQNFDNHSGSIQTYTYQGQTYTAHIMVISDPQRIRVETTKYLGKQGETVQQMVADAGAVAGINGGAFSDNNQQGTGANPLGITISNGKVITGANSHQRYAEIAFTQGGQLIAGDYSLADLQQEGVREALSFGPVLVMNGKPVQTADQGYNPRSAIGQTSDGKVILIVTDGRGQFGHLGASLADMTALMLKYNAVIAADLDGGSSTTMVYNNQLVNTPVDLTGARSVATSFVVMPESGGQ
ncbi:phosphodiester glycosidase family protein [Alicyclobacillus fastidiosus]|uniref:Phosphodiester glycosidase family protein n=1 Tax=Alicyclobacillus fastidiosus TaxID=392011 RepID=A0ABY6ZC56_9BACL|nr:phosphodiester glycosidase family protein [Alicyclobacillus fastidiosus]WAH40315.1 phosphodiester glycosidase family protein [Alicyclobacillus fastidiosus]GMA61697.1 hypothetical protein GCM10025859_21370 [Alicyclobacillus fastidiosus]